MEPSEKKTFGELLKAFRTRPSKYPILNQKGLADKLGVSEETISAWERGKVHRPSERNLIIRLRNALHLSDIDTNELLFAAQYPLLSEEERREKQKAKGAVDREVDCTPKTGQ